MRACKKNPRCSLSYLLVKVQFYCGFVKVVDKLLYIYVVCFCVFAILNVLVFVLFGVLLD